MEQFRKSLEACEICKQHRVVRPTLLEVAIHFRYGHEALLEALQDAVVIEQAVMLRMIDNG